MEDNYKQLGNAIVIQAVADYRKVLHILSCYPNDTAAKYERKQIERFFRSDWFTMLTDIDPERLITKLNMEEAG